MSDTTNSGGPALPKTGRFHHDGPACFDSENQDGMTLRDYAAMHAPIEVSDANEFFYREHSRSPGLGEMLDLLAQLRFRYADAMLKARDGQ